MDSRSILGLTWVVANVLLVLSLFSSAPKARSIHVDRIEINTCHCYSTPFEQVIFWEWDAEYLRYNVIGWCVTEQVSFVPGGVLHQSGWTVRSRIIDRTDTLDDPERRNRELLADHYRKRLPWERFGK